MKKNIFYPLLCCIASISVFSCSMFTTSLAKGARRDQKDFLKKASASELIAFSQGSYASDTETTQAILDLLSEKSSDELKSLSLKEKERVLDLTLDASFPMKTLKEIGRTASDALSGNSNLSAEDAKKMLNDFTGSLSPFDTTASSRLLSDPEAMRKADPSVLANAAVSVMLQATAGVKLPPEAANIDFKNNTADDIVTKILGSGPQDQTKKDTLKAAVETVKLLSGAEATDSEGQQVQRPIKPEDVKLLGVIPLGDILEQFKKS